MSTSTWTGAVSSDWAVAGNWSPAGVPGASSDVTIATGSPVASASIGTVNSITDSSYLSFESAGTNAVTTLLDDTGHLYVEGGTILNIGGAMTNSGYLYLGNTTLSAPDEVTAASLDNTGRIYLIGSGADATNFGAPPATTFNFVENIAGTGGTLTLTDMSLSLSPTANIQMTGDYSNKSFTLAHDSGTGTLVKFV